MDDPTAPMSLDGTTPGPESADPVLAPGTVLEDRYVIEEPIGAGGFGTVYRARQLPLGRHVAIKMLPPKALLDRAQIARFEHEASLFQRLEHPNTVKLIDFGIARGAPFIVMELLRGESLAALIEREGPQPLARAARVATDVLKALMEAHAVGIIHRDIKPANVFITRPAGDPFFVKLLDFGIAKETGGEAVASTRRPEDVATRSAALTGAGQTMGTPRYMAPEQVFAEAVGPATDLYALGLTLAEMLSGVPVFGSQSVTEILAQQSSMVETELPEIVRASRLGAVIARAISKAPSDRFHSAEEMLAAVEALDIDASRAATMGAPAVRITVADGEKVGVFDATAATPLASERAPRAAASAAESRVMALAVGAPIVLLAVAAAVFAFSGRGHETGARDATPDALARASSSGVAPAPLSSETPEALPRKGTILVRDADDIARSLAPVGFHVSKYGIGHPADNSVVVNVESATCAGGITLWTFTDGKLFKLAAEAMGNAVEPRTPLVVDEPHRQVLLVGLGGLGVEGERCKVAAYHALAQPE